MLGLTVVFLDKDPLNTAYQRGGGSPSTMLEMNFIWSYEKSNIFKSFQIIITFSYYFLKEKMMVNCKFQVE